MIEEWYVVWQSLCKFCSGEALALKCNINQRCYLCLCEHCQCPIWLLKTTEKKNFPMETQEFPELPGRLPGSAVARLCADTPELFWPATEPSQLHRGHWSPSFKGWASSNPTQVWTQGKPTSALDLSACLPCVCHATSQKCKKATI